MRLEEATFVTGEVSINYAEGPPNGPPFVLLHGGAGRWQYGQAFLDLIAEDWHVYAPDFRGHGKSGPRPNAYRLIDYVRDTAAFLSTVVGQPAVVFGHSLGGEVAVKTASLHLASFRALVVGDAPLSARNLATEEPTHRAQNRLWQSLADRGVDEIVPALKDMLVRVPRQSQPQPARNVFGEDHPWFDHQALSLHQLEPEMLAAVLEGPAQMLRDYEPEVLLPPITCPVLLLQADARSEPVRRLLKLDASTAPTAAATDGYYRAHLGLARNAGPARHQLRQLFPTKHPPTRPATIRQITATSAAGAHGRSARRGT